MQPESNGKKHPARLGRSLAGGALLAAPGAMALVLLLATRSLSGAETPGEGAGGGPPLCSGWHRGDDRSRAIDLETTERGYREFRESLSQALSHSMRTQVAQPSPMYDARLPACTKGVVPRGMTAAAVPEALRGKRLWFFSLAKGKTPRLPKEAENDPHFVPLATKVERTEDLVKAATLLGRPVSLAPMGLGEALGVRCIPAVVSITKEGQVDIHEVP